MTVLTMRWLKAGVLLAALARAGAAAAQTEAEPAPLTVVQVEGLSDPDEVTYRSLLKGMDAFEQHHQLAPQATLRYRILPRLPKVQREGIALRLHGDSINQPVPLDAELGFTLARPASARDEDATITSNRKARSFAWMPDVRTPGLPPHTRRLGDLRLECEVNRVADIIHGFKTPSWYALNAATDLCTKKPSGWLIYADQPLFGATLTDGTRHAALLSNHLYGQPIPSAVQGFYDFLPLLQDRALFVDISDASWSDDTLIDIEYMDAETDAAPQSPAAPQLTVGKTTKTELSGMPGQAAVTRFPSGDEVWVYSDQRHLPDFVRLLPLVGLLSRRLDTAGGEREIALLFGPDGVLRKYAVRTAPSKPARP